MHIHNIDYFLCKNELDKNYPSTLIIPNKETIVVPENATAYGFVTADSGTALVANRSFNLYRHMFISAPAGSVIKDMQGFLCLREKNNGLFSLGGPVERLGRLKYIDGCSDTLLLSPLECGEPCLNYLYVPSHIDQTAHTHPSVRVGCVLEGAGYCWTQKGIINLLPGNIFILEPEEIHSFHTKENFLRIAVYHPDSDFGPTHAIHPMVNKTYVEGVSVKGDNQYRTTKIN